MTAKVWHQKAQCFAHDTAGWEWKRIWWNQQKDGSRRSGGFPSTGRISWKGKCTDLKTVKLTKRRSGCFPSTGRIAWKADLRMVKSVQTRKKKKWMFPKHRMDAYISWMMKHTDLCLPHVEQRLFVVVGVRLGGLTGVGVHVMVDGIAQLSVPTCTNHILHVSVKHSIYLSIYQSIYLYICIHSRLAGATALKDDSYLSYGCEYIQGEQLHDRLPSIVHTELLPF